MAKNNRRSTRRRRGATLIYIHIPKTAGTTIMGVLRANYGDRFHRVENRGGWRDFQRWTAKRRDSVRCLTGHMPWGMHRAIGRPHMYATMLRDPVDRVLSLYYYIRSRPAHTRYKLAQRLDVVGFVRSARVSDTDNGMTRFLAGRDDVGIREPAGPATEADLALAKEHMTQFASVGFVEDFDRSIAGFAWAFAWDQVGYTSMLVNKANRQAPGAGVLEVIRQANQLDAALYRWAWEKWHAS